MPKLEAMAWPMPACPLPSVCEWAEARQAAGGTSHAPCAKRGSSSARSQIIHHPTVWIGAEVIRPDVIAFCSAARLTPR
jgi:hypothetical protein